MSNFQISALNPTAFLHLFELENHELLNLGAVRMLVDKPTGFPCRISLQNAAVGEQVILLTYQHHDTSSPYRASGPVFIKQNAVEAIPAINEIPAMLLQRLLSVRAYDSTGMMLQADVIEGEKLYGVLTAWFEDAAIDYIHLHSAKHGCYNCSVTRV